MSSSLRALLLLCFSVTFALASLGCEGETTSDPDAGLVIRTVSSYQGYVYASGSYRFSFNSTVTPQAEAMLTIFDANDPSNPVLIETRDFGTTQSTQVIGDQLIAVQSGNAADGGARDMTVDVYDLADPSNPQRVKSITVPGTAGAQVAEFRAVAEGTVLLSLNDGLDSDTSDVTFVIKLANAAGTEVTGTSMRGCREAVGIADRIFCMSAVGQGSGRVTTFELGASGTITELASVADPLLQFTQEAQALSPDLILVSDQYSGLVAYPVAAGSISAGDRITPDSAQHHFLMSLAAGPAQSVISMRTNEVRSYDRVSGAQLASLPYPGNLAESAVGGSQVRHLSGNTYVAAMGDYGILFFSADASGGLAKLGGYFRSWFKTGNGFDTEDFLEGSY